MRSKRGALRDESGIGKERVGDQVECEWMVLSPRARRSNPDWSRAGKNQVKGRGLGGLVRTPIVRKAGRQEGRIRFGDRNGKMRSVKYNGCVGRRTRAGIRKALVYNRERRSGREEEIYTVPFPADVTKSESLLGF